ncbi:AAA family ATPase [Candidatus Zixiibacteriota bacterium]
MTSIEALVDRQMKRRALAERAGQYPAEAAVTQPMPLRAITISRQAGSRGRTLAARIAAKLGFEFVDRQILELLVKNTGARKRLIDSLDERTRSGIDLWVEGILTRRYIDRTEYTHRLAEAVTVMAEDGDAVILGRGGNIILGQRGGLHIRIVAPIQSRVDNICRYDKLSQVEALARVEKLDDERRQFYRDNFDADIDNPRDYHLMINTGRVEFKTAQEIILTAWQRYLAGEQGR